MAHLGPQPLVDNLLEDVARQLAIIRASVSVHPAMERPAGGIRNLDDVDLPSYVSDEEDNIVVDEEDEDWSGEDSGYDTMTEASDDEEHDDPSEDLGHVLARVLVPPSCVFPVVPPGPLRAEDPAPSTSGHILPTKRSWEESHSEQVSAKRPKTDSEGSLDEPTPSTSGLSFSSRRIQDDNHWSAVPSTSGLSFITSSRPSLRCPLWPLLDDSDSDSD